MSIPGRFLSMMVLVLLAVANLSILGVRISPVEAESMGTLSGTIYDWGEDMDLDGFFDVLEVGVEVDVSTAGMVYVEVMGLYDAAYQHINAWGSAYTYVDLGIQVINVSLDGLTIYASGLDPTNVSAIYLRDEYHTSLDDAYNVPLSHTYAYTDFDSPPAVLTGIIHDRGVDRDGDGAFDYLEVGVEVDVTDAGGYRVEVSSLLDSSYSYISVWNHTSAALATGLHLVNVTLRGFTINAAHMNPTNVSEIALYSVEFTPPDEHITSWLGTLYNAPLSREYLYTEFDAPMRDVDVTFVVYPDGRVHMSGASSSDVEPPNLGPSIQGVAAVQMSHGVSDIAATFTLTIPSEEMSEFPFNASALSVLAEYADDMLTTTVIGSTVLPSSVASQLPFNITDFTVMGTCSGGLVAGNITADMYNGFPLGGLTVDFEGNHTYVHLSGSTSVIFGTYPGFGELNASVLDYLLAYVTTTLGGQSPGSLYNMTSGLLEFTMLQNVTTIDGTYATVEFEAQLEGDLIEALVNMTEQPGYLSDMLHSAWASVGSGSLVLAYTHTLRQADFNLVFVANATQLINHMIPLLSDILPPDEAALAETILNTMYCTLESAQISVAYDDGYATITATASILDLNAEVNYLKHLLLDYAIPLPWTLQAYAMNATWIDLNTLSLSFNLTETWLMVDVDGFIVQPPLDWVNATSFTLERFFNITASDEEPPQANERLTVTVIGGSNATHTVTLTGSGTVPEPDISTPIAATWYNQSISHLKDLVFHLGTRDTTPPTIYPCVQTPQTPDFDEVVTVSVNVTDADPGVRPDGVILSYRTNGGAWTNVTMGHLTGDTYQGTIPALPVGTHVEYMIVAYDYADNEAVDDASGLYYVYTVIPEFSIWPILAAALLVAGLVLAIMKRRHVGKA
jgi:hypothetical protein